MAIKVKDIFKNPLFVNATGVVPLTATIPAGAGQHANKKNAIAMAIVWSDTAGNVVNIKDQAGAVKLSPKVPIGTTQFIFTEHPLVPGSATGASDVVVTGLGNATIDLIYGYD